MAAIVAPKLTYAHLQAMPNDGKRYELLDGEVYMTPSPTTQHQRLVGRLYLLLHEFGQRTGSGEVLFAPLDVVFDDRNVVQPDLLFVRSERRTTITPAFVAGPPDLVIEVLSPSNAAYDREKKLPVYARAGVPEIWYIDPPTETLEILSLSSDRRYTRVALGQKEGKIASAAFPDLAVDLRSLFAGG